MLVQFKLSPLDEIQPWGEAGDESLHWFGLSDGLYWLDVGDEELLRYSDRACERFGGPRYCNYYLARIHEDLLDMMPRTLEPVPAALVPYLCGESASAWERDSRAWYEREERPGNDLYWEASLWVDDRSLVTNYLSPPANVRLWSDAEFVTISWDNTEATFDGAPAWSATRGSYRLTRDQFIDEVKSFHSRLMRAMQARLNEVIDADLPSRIRVDVAGLKQEHEQRCRELELALSRRPDPTDWARVQRAIAAVEREIAAG
jgi:hypothetical protein